MAKQNESIFSLYDSNVIEEDEFNLGPPDNIISPPPGIIHVQINKKKVQKELVGFDGVLDAIQKMANKMMEDSSKKIS